MPSADESAHLDAARTGDEGAFRKLTEPYRREVTVHGYRMLGSLQDAEDMMQETLLRAWRRLETFRHNVSFRAWLYKIATNICLDMLSRRPRRSLPAFAGKPGDPRGPVLAPIEQPVWLEPIPDEWLIEAEANPEERTIARESIRLAFLVALHVLPPRQRAVLILSDVLNFRAKEVAELLDATLSSVTSALHRARSAMAGHEVSLNTPTPPMTEDAATRRLLDEYMQAWDKADTARLVALLKADATFAMPPRPSWYQGRENVAAFFAHRVFGPEPSVGSWRLVPTRANGQPAFAVYRRGGTADAREAFAIQVLTLVRSGEQIAAITNFMSPELFPRFGMEER